MGAPVVVHAGHAPVAAAHTGPEPFAALLARHPRLTHLYARQIAGLTRVDLGDDWLRAVCWDSATAMFGETSARRQDG